MIVNEFRPSILVPKDGNYETEKGDFLTDESFLEGIVMRACSDNEIYHSNAFMVKTEDGEKAAPDKYKKIQDKVFFEAYAKICCREELCNRQDCYKSDAYAAEIVAEKFEELKSGVRLENEYIGNLTIVNVASSDRDQEYIREGIRYICQHTGYTEIAFPVKLYDRVMGALIVGQIIAEKDQDHWCETIEKKCENAQYDEEKIEEIKKYVKDAKSETEIKGIIENVSKAVDAIEKELVTVYENRQKQYGLEQSNIYVAKFKCNFKIEKKEIEATTRVFPTTTCIEIYAKLGSCIRDCIDDFCRAVGVERHALFLPDEKNLTNNDYSQLRSGEMILRIDGLTEENSGKTFLCDKEIVNKYVKNMDFEYDYIIISEMEGYPIALLLCIEGFLHEIGSEAEKRLLTESLSDIFGHIFSYVQMAGIQAKSEYFRTYLDSSMSIMRHELGQSNAGYQILLERFRKNMVYCSTKVIDGHHLSAIEDVYTFLDNCEDFIRDSEKYLYTTKIRIDSTKYLMEFNPKVKHFFYPYEEFLFKWQHIYYKTAKENNLEFKIPRIVQYDPSRPRMYGDPMMAEQAVYNLTNNAIKYALQGTRVSLDCRLSDDKTRYEIVVRNVGHPLSKYELDTIFEYGKRGSNNKKDGSGLGLYLTKQIALAHNGNVDCEMTTLSEYNWPLVKLYMDLYNDRGIKYFCKDHALYEELEKEWQSKKAEIEKYVVREVPHNAFSAMYVHQHIRQGTAEFIFTFWLPHVE